MSEISQSPAIPPLYGPDGSVAKTAAPQDSGWTESNHEGLAEIRRIQREAEARRLRDYRPDYDGVKVDGLKADFIPLDTAHAVPAPKAYTLVEISDTRPVTLEAGTAALRDKRAALEAAQKAAREKVGSLPEAQKVRELRRKLKELDQADADLEAKLAENTRQYEEAVHAGSGEVAALEAEAAQLAVQQRRNRVLRRAVFGGNPGSPGYQADNAPAIQAAQAAYEAAASSALREPEYAAQQESRKAEQALTAKMIAALAEWGVAIGIERRWRQSMPRVPVVAEVPNVG